MEKAKNSSTLSFILILFGKLDKVSHGLYLQE